MGRQNARLAAMSPDKVFHPIYVAILLRRDDQTLLNYINIWLDQIELDGTLGKISARSGWATRDSAPSGPTPRSSTGPETPLAAKLGAPEEDINAKSCCSAC